MNYNPGIVTNDWDKKLSHEELLARLTALKHRAVHALPILDDDDLEAAIEEAADRLTLRHDEVDL
ncbi:hypothetical protein [Actinomadura sp. 7K534]|uniref:hypothetical protein n=1 Tax=Actinomadura sp. 7K534 TaxID=2530366 RepID=UPI001051BD9C|nr:hypothetical protein [Actinomadura sp. 7K534]TDB92377.1 hypothetical protein E1266_24495 [Actinomadura sp. 7K534]